MRAPGAALLLALLLAAVGGGPAAARESAGGAAGGPVGGTRTPVQHFVYVLQGDRTFDHYFGTYPGADGLTAGLRQPVEPGRPERGTVAPYPLHGTAPAAPGAGPRLVRQQYDGGRMDAFVAAFTRQGRDGRLAMGHYDRRDLPFHWNAADRYELFDHFFASSLDGTRANRAHWVTGTPELTGPTVFDRLEEAGVSWKFYVQNYDPRATYRAAGGLSTQPLRVPLLAVPRFVDDPRLPAHIVDLGTYYRDLEAGTLPAVAFVAPSGAAERSARSVAAGQRLLRELTTQLMVSRYWPSSALLWSYDGSGGWYDHVRPPAGLGLRVPALLVGPYVPRGVVQHGRFEAASALRFVVENWRLRPLGGRAGTARSLADAFRFDAPPRRAELIPDGEPGTAALPVVRRPRPGPVYAIYGMASAVVAGLLWGAVRPRWRTS
ncbi:alkaline phosphatase family protein [Streptomyces griseosporeus]|uniref:alkaline phosphatase family protein n=1 Tax=Streptomyces griseosporeus TaxID=1910 RepID=UPI00167DF50F|nr:alkaline phosphatase family protein [Streptomyces griseosporeus]GHF44515.1 phospholipase C 4 [Streptomyces griseosporeus]